MVNGQGEWVQDAGKTHYQLTFQDEVLDQGTRYLAVASGAKKRVDSIVLRPASDLMTSGKGADQVIIVHEDFRKRVEPLVELRRNQGLLVEVVEVGEIYDQFGHGLFTPEAIRDFLKYAYQNITRNKVFPFAPIKTHIRLFYRCNRRFLSSIPHSLFS